jgi:hypothetical protein
MSEPNETGDLTRQDIEDRMQDIGRATARILPGQLFCVIVFGPDGIGQYVSNAERASVITALREFADVLAARDDTPAETGGLP